MIHLNGQISGYFHVVHMVEKMISNCQMMSLCCLGLGLGLWCVKGKEGAKIASWWVKNLLQSTGFVVYDVLSVSTPSHYCVTWFEIQDGRVCLSVLHKKLDALVLLLKASLYSSSFRAKHIAYSKIISMGTALWLVHLQSGWLISVSLLVFYGRSVSSWHVVSVCEFEGYGVASSGTGGPWYTAQWKGWQYY